MSDEWGRRCRIGGVFAALLVVSPACYRRAPIADVFRLCEARANGDVTPEQYNMLLERFLSSIQRRDERAGGARRAQSFGRPQRDPKQWHGEDAGGLSDPTPNPPLPAGAPMDSGLPAPPPTAPDPVPLQPVSPATQPAPSTGALPDARR